MSTLPRSIYATHFPGPACPVSLRQVDERVVRVTAVLTAALLPTAILGPPAAAIFLALAADFAARAAGLPRYSPLAWIARGLVSVGARAGWLAARPRPVDAAPKRFAAACGLLFALAIALALVLGAPRALTGAVLAMFAACALLEGLLGYCVGCAVYAGLPPRLRGV